MATNNGARVSRVMFRIIAALLFVATGQQFPGTDLSRLRTLTTLEQLEAMQLVLEQLGKARTEREWGANTLPK